MAAAQPSASISRMLIASDGLEYENITQRLLGNPADTQANRTLKHIRNFCGEDSVRLFLASRERCSPNRR